MWGHVSVMFLLRRILYGANPPYVTETTPLSLPLHVTTRAVRNHRWGSSLDASGYHSDRLADFRRVMSGERFPNVRCLTLDKKSRQVVDDASWPCVDVSSLMV
jgi:hypothetical protein